MQEKKALASSFLTPHGSLLSLRPGLLFVTILAEFLLPLMLVHLALFALTSTRHDNLPIIQLSAFSSQLSAKN